LLRTMRTVVRLLDKLMPYQEPKLAAITVVGDQKRHGTSCRPGAGAELDQLEKKSSSKSEALPQLDLLLDGNAGSKKPSGKKSNGTSLWRAREQSGRGSGPSPFTSPIIFIS
jgi:hypothetical protein